MLYRWNPRRKTSCLQICLQTLLRMGLLCTAAGAAQAQTAASEARIRQVENGLLPAVITPRTAPMKLAQRMRQLQVPGLSAAVVDHGQLVWAHAWGVAQPGRAMTTDSLDGLPPVNSAAVRVKICRWI